MEKVQLTNIEQLDQIVSESFDQTVAVFKHSTRCGISKFVLKDFESALPELSSSEFKFKYYHLDLILYRTISDAIAERFSIQHESPQLIVFKSGEVVHHSSHSEIQASSIL